MNRINDSYAKGIGYCYNCKKSDKVSQVRRFSCGNWLITEEE